MSDEKPATEPMQIPIKADDATQAGLYSNLARISHTPEAFLVDFLVVHSHPPYGRLQSRLILSPGHAKRLLRALKENLDRYERVNGEIAVSEPPAPGGYLQ